MKYTFKALGVVSIISLVIGVVFFDNIKGYLRFKEYCEKEGGLHVYEPLARNVGLLADSYDAAQIAAQLQYVDFVRYKNKKDEQLYDLHYTGGDPQILKSYVVTPADESKNTMYHWIDINYFVANENNLFKFGYEITDASKKNTLARYYMFEYLLYVGPLDSKSTTTCFAEGGKSVSDIARWRKDFIKAFKN